MNEGKYGYLQSIIMAISCLPLPWLFVLYLAEQIAADYLIMFSIGHLQLRGWGWGAL